MRVLVSGGAGYIGSHTVVQLIAAGHDVLIVDNFANSKPTVVNRLEALTGTHLPVHAFDLTDHDKTEHLFATEKIDAVIHFAGLKAVGESVELPLEYYENNLGSTFSLVRAMRRHGVDKLVFSSSATVYGTNQEAATEDRADLGDQPLRLDQGHAGADPARRGRGRPEHALRPAALLQPGGRPRQRHHGRGPAGHPQQPRALHLAGRRRAPRDTSRSSATTTRPRTGRALGTTSTSRTWPRGTSQR